MSLRDYKRPGRPKGARDKLTLQVFTDALEVWNEPAIEGGNITRGREALMHMYQEKPVEYVKAMFSIMPREIAIDSVQMDEGEIDELMVQLRDYIKRKKDDPGNDDDRAGGEGAGAPGEGQGKADS